MRGAKVERFFPRLESFYGNSSQEIFLKLKSTQLFQRNNKKRLDYYITTIERALSSKNYFSDFNILSPNSFNLNIRRILVGLDLLTYTDLAIFSAQLTDGERRYFFAQTLLLVSQRQRDSLWKNLLIILDRVIFSNTTNAVSYDWDFFPMVTKEMRISFLSWGIFSIKDILFYDLSITTLAKYFLPIFNNDFKLLTSFLNRLYALLTPSRSPSDIESLFIPTSVSIIPTFLQQLRYDNYLSNPSSFSLPFDLLGGGNSIIPRIAMGSVSRILNVMTLIKPFLVLDSEYMIKFLAPPIYELANIILAALYFSPINLRVGTRIIFSFIVRTSDGDFPLDSTAPPNIKFWNFYNREYLYQIFSDTADISFWHSLTCDDVWNFATGLDTSQENVLRYSVQTPPVLVTDQKKLKEILLNELMSLFKAEYQPFHQIIGVNAQLVFSEGINVRHRSYLQNSISLLHNQFGYFSPSNGLRLNPNGSRSFANSLRLKSIFTFDPDDPLTFDLVLKTLNQQIFKYIF